MILFKQCTTLHRLQNQMYRALTAADATVQEQHKPDQGVALN
jgi:hypothetical protein